jgi:hypothetical protein
VPIITRKQMVLILFTSVATLTWFRFKPIYYADMGLGTTVGPTPPQYIVALIRANLLGVSPWVYPGTPLVPSSILYTFTVNLVHMVLPLWFSQFIYVYVVALFAQAGVCALTNRALGGLGAAKHWWIGVTSAAYYFYGPFYQFFVGDGAYLPLGFYASYPFMVYSAIGLTEASQGGLGKYLKDVLILLVAFFVGSGGFTYYYYITGLGSVTLIALLYALLNRRSWAGFGRGAGGLLLGLLTAQLSVAPIVAHDFVSAPTLAESNTTTPNLLTLFLRRTQQTTYFHELTQYLWPAPGPFAAVQPNVPPYLISPIVGAVFAAAALGLIFLQTRGKQSRRSLMVVVAPFLASYFAAVALAAGPQEPFGPALIYAYTRIWFVRAITESFTSLAFILQLSLAMLLAAALAASTKSTNGPRGKTVVAASAILIVSAVALMSPYLAGAPLPVNHLTASLSGQTQAYSVTPRVNVPQYFYDLVSYVDTLPPHGAVLLLPIGGNFRTTSWYMAVDALASTLNKPVVGGGYVATPQTQALVYLIDMWESGVHIGLQSLLARMAVGYIIVEGDAASAPPYTPEPAFNIEYIEAQLNATPNVVFLHRFGPDIVYRVAWTNSGSVTTLWAKAPQPSYGFSAYTQAVETQPEPQAPYIVLFNSSTAKLEPDGYQCAAGGGQLVIGLLGGYGQCVYRTLINASTPIYASYAYPPTALNVGVELLNQYNGTVVGTTVESGATGGMDYGVTLFPPGQYGGVIVYAAASTVSQKLSLPWVYLSAATQPSQLVGYDVAPQTLYVTSPSGAVGAARLVLNSTEPPALRSSSCSAYGCTLYANATQPFFLVYYAAYSDAYTLYVNGVADRYHYIGYGSFNTWLVNATGHVTLVVKYTDGLLPYEAVSAVVWVVVVALNVYLWLQPKRTLRAHH